MEDKIENKIFPVFGNEVIDFSGYDEHYPISAYAEELDRHFYILAAIGSILHDTHVIHTKGQRGPSKLAVYFIIGV